MPSNDSVAGSGTALLSPEGEFTPARNTMGGRFAVLPLSPQARKLNTSVAASAVRWTDTKFQSVIPPDGVDISGVATMEPVGSVLV
jgi:nitrous oxidase accessory protein NosD